MGRVSLGVVDDVEEPVDTEALDGRFDDVFPILVFDEPLKDVLGLGAVSGGGLGQGGSLADDSAMARLGHVG